MPTHTDCLPSNSLMGRFKRNAPNIFTYQKLYKVKKQVRSLRESANEYNQ